MFKATTRKQTPSTFKPCLEALEERSMLDGSPSASPTSVPPVQLSQSQVFTEMALTVLAAPSASGQQETSNGPYNTLQNLSNNWNVLAGAIKSIDLGKLGPLAESLAESVRDSIKEEVNNLALQAVSRLPVGTAHAGGDYALAVLGTLQMFGGSIKGGLKLAEDAISDYWTGIVQKPLQQFMQENFSLSPGAPSSGAPSKTIIYDENAPRNNP